MDGGGRGGLLLLGVRDELVGLRDVLHNLAHGGGGGAEAVSDPRSGHQVRGAKVPGEALVSSSMSREHISVFIILSGARQMWRYLLRLAVGASQDEWPTDLRGG